MMSGPMYVEIEIEIGDFLQIRPGSEPDHLSLCRYQPSRIVILDLAGFDNKISRDYHGEWISDSTALDRTRHGTRNRIELPMNPIPPGTMSPSGEPMNRTIPGTMSPSGECRHLANIAIWRINDCLNYTMIQQMKASTNFKTKMPTRTRAIMSPLWTQIHAMRIHLHM